MSFCINAGGGGGRSTYKFHCYFCFSEMELVKSFTRREVRGLSKKKKRAVARRALSPDKKRV